MKESLKKVVIFYLVVGVIAALSYAGASARNILTDEMASQFLYQKGLLTGDNGDLMLEQQLTREQMIVLISRLKGAEETARTYPTNNMTFMDVPKEHWAAPYIAWASAEKITQGYSPEKFGLGDSLTGWQTKAFFIKTLGITNIKDEQVESQADRMGITVGIIVDPNNPIKRKEMAVMMYNTLYAKDMTGNVMGEKLKFVQINPMDKVPFVKVEKSIYFTNEQENNSIYSIDIDGKNRILLSRDNALNIRVQDGYIFYTNKFDNNKIYRITVGGKDRRKLVDSQSEIVSVENGGVYFIDFSKNGSLFRVSIDGSRVATIIKDSIKDAKMIGGWLYYTNITKGGKLYKARLDGTQQEIINFDQNSVKVSGYGKAFFINYANGEKIYSTNIEDGNIGTTKLQITADAASNINIKNESIYFINKSDNNSIYKIGIDGTGCTKLIASPTSELQVVGNNLYYINNSDKGRIYKADLSGKDQIGLSDGKSSNMIVSDGYIYYISLEGQAPALYRIQLDGKGKEMVCADSMTDIKIAKDYIYYKNYSDNGKLYKVKTTGGKGQKLVNDSVDSFDIVDNYVFYINVSDNSYIYKVDTNGENRTKVVNNIGKWLICYNDTVYYSSLLDNLGIFKLKVDGTSNVRSSKYPGIAVRGAGNVMFYLNIEEGLQLNIIPVQGGREIIPGQQ